jgi:hypothetical protein
MLKSANDNINNLYELVSKLGLQNLCHLAWVLDSELVPVGMGSDFPD